MAAGDKTDFVIYHAEFWSGMSEILAQNGNAFNAASMNCIRMITMMMRGDYGRESFMKAISTLATRRDITDSTNTVADTALTQDEFISVKLNRRLGPVNDTLDAFRKIAPDEDAQRLFSFQLGQQMATAVQLDMLNSALLGAVAALANQSVAYDATNGTIQFVDLVAGLALFGDRAQMIRCWVMHSKPFFDLFGDGISNYQVTNVAGNMIVTGMPVSLGRPIVVTDSASLVDTSASPDEYSTLGLVEDGIQVIESEQREIVEDMVTGYENLMLRIQGEYAYNLKLKGFQWDTGNGGANPDDTALGTGSNWDKAATSDKDLAGIVITSQ